MLLKNNKGVTLIELLGALALLGILVGLIVTTVSIFIRTTNTSISESQIQTEGLLLVRNIENRILRHIPDDIRECDNGTNCVVLSSSELDQELEINVVGSSIFFDSVDIFPSNLEDKVTEIRLEYSIESTNNVILNIVVELNNQQTFRSSNLFRRIP